MIHRYLFRYGVAILLGVISFMIIGLHLRTWWLIHPLELYNELLMTLQENRHLFLSRAVFNLFEFNDVLALSWGIAFQVLIKVIQSFTGWEILLLLGVPYLVYMALGNSIKTQKISQLYLRQSMLLLVSQVGFIAIAALCLFIFYASPSAYIKSLTILLLATIGLQLSLTVYFIYRWYQLLKTPEDSLNY